jgi:putative hydrolase of the HAD superfamily
MELGVNDADVARTVGGIYHDRREATLSIFPDSVQTLEWLRQHGCRLALLTNGSAAAQRRKIETFGLERFFDAIFIEGEVGFGKPDHRVYQLALDRLSVRAPDTWMVGDNLDWDVAQPKKLGISTVWVDLDGNGHSRLGTIQPDRVVRKISDLKNLRY